MQTEFLDSLTREYGNRLMDLYQAVQTTRPYPETLDIDSPAQLTLDRMVADYAAASSALGGALPRASSLRDREGCPARRGPSAGCGLRR